MGLADDILPGNVVFFHSRLERITTLILLGGFSNRLQDWCSFEGVSHGLLGKPLALLVATPRITMLA